MESEIHIHILRMGRECVCVRTYRPPIGLKLSSSAQPNPAQPAKLFRSPSQASVIDARRQKNSYPLAHPCLVQARDGSAVDTTCYIGLLRASERRPYSAPNRSSHCKDGDGLFHFDHNSHVHESSQVNTAHVRKYVHSATEPARPSQMSN
ncbi:hypothetical protein T310_0176 [Rasamsonia emersonii CBS 393.64]|uniref:Uncharacterized protein n=1 Tax=Rasamsonia emersonii (strain ATCC 16479 / CBS 393.64 / IMI 116815) TaxID=1408163 RepID=A0A0F4Z643_RASE3|nr:hypothetical protein T310_0176 [Rasamsonia emersonii CBS 393.64]KKA25790.1 hypothetical protein T310_0176 [Rasamsonia emersonii CBS 393.64]